MSKKLFVGGINYDSSEDALAEYFGQAGTVESAVIITDKMTGRSKGFGFVEFNSHLMKKLKKPLKCSTTKNSKAGNLLSTKPALLDQGINIFSKIF